jgi:hypothetical protein
MSESRISKTLITRKVTPLSIEESSSPSISRNTVRMGSDLLQSYLETKEKEEVSQNESSPKARPSRLQIPAQPSHASISSGKSAQTIEESLLDGEDNRPETPLINPTPYTAQSGSFFNFESLQDPMVKISEQILKAIKQREEKKDTEEKNIEEKHEVMSPPQQLFSPVSSETKSPIQFSSPPNIASFSSMMGFSGKGQLRSYQVVSSQALKINGEFVTSRKLDPMIFWEQQTGIAFCTLNVDYQAINKKKTLWDVYQEMILDHPDKISYPFNLWFDLFIEHLPNDDTFKDYYLKGSEKSRFTLTTLDEKTLEKFEFKWIAGKAYVRGDHPNKPYDPTFINEKLPLKQQWLLLDTTLFAKKSPEERKECLFEKEAPSSNRPNRMIYVKNNAIGKRYTAIDQPGKIFHSTFVRKSYHSENTALYKDDHDGGTFIVERGICIEAKNDSGHLQPTKETTIHRGLGKDIAMTKAYKTMKDLFIYDRNKVIHLKGPEAIEKFLRDEGMFDEKSHENLHKNPKAPFEDYLHKKQNKLKNKKQHRDSLLVKRSSAANEEIIKLIDLQINSLQDKKNSKEEYRFLNLILENYRNDLRKAASIAKETISSDTFEKIIASNKAKFGFYKPKNATREILKKIDDLPYPGASFISKKKK